MCYHARRQKFQEICSMSYDSTNASAYNLMLTAYVWSFDQRILQRLEVYSGSKLTDRQNTVSSKESNYLWLNNSWATNNWVSGEWCRAVSLCTCSVLAHFPWHLLLAKGYGLDNDLSDLVLLILCSYFLKSASWKLSHKPSPERLCIIFLKSSYSRKPSFEARKST